MHLQPARLRNVSAPLLWGDKCWLTKKWNTWLQKMKFCDIEGDIQDVLQWSNPFRMIYSWVNTSPFDLDGVEKERPVQRGRTSFKDIIVPTNSCLGSSRSQCVCRIGVIWYEHDWLWLGASPELGSNFLVPMWMTFDKPLHRYMLWPLAFCPLVSREMPCSLASWPTTQNLMKGGFWRASCLPWFQPFGAISPHFVEFVLKTRDFVWN